MSVGEAAQRVFRAVATRGRASLAAWRARRSTRANLERVTGRRVLVVCYGNIYRSPFVARALEQRLGSMAEIRSGGFHPVAQRPSPARHVEMCRQRGVLLEDHRSAVLTAEDFVWADLVVLMDRHNWAMSTRLGAKPEQLIWLGALTAGAIDIGDPYRMTDTQAAEIVDRLGACSEALAAALGARHGGN